jgi:hypothetical protein
MRHLWYCFNMIDRKTLSSLLKATAYPEPTRTVSLIQTHISYLFLTDRYVYKVKKDVNFGFLDFSTLDRRNFYCHEEVRLNARLCPGIYQKVVPLVLTDEGAAFDRKGEILDYAVKMVRLPAERMLDRLVEQNEVTEEEMRSVARTIAEFHNRAERSAEIDSGGDPETLMKNCLENFQQLAPYIGRTVSGNLLAELQDWTDGWLETRSPLFRERVEGGFIRDCDGDIHLSNICLWDHPYIFDCIEFNQRFRHIDTAADIAFLLMDLDCHGRSDLADAVLDEYRRCSGDHHLNCVLPFYKVYRALVRAKIASLTLDDSGIDDSTRSAASEQARCYLEQARRYLVQAPVNQRLIITSGLMGTGKSYVAVMLAPRIAALVLSSDRTRKEMAGIPLDERSQDGYNEGIYSPAFSNAVYLELLARARDELRSGCSVIVDASFQRRSDRELFQHLAKAAGVSFAIVETRCDEEIVRQRLKERSRQRHSVSDGRWEIFPRQKDSFDAFTEHEIPILTLDTNQSREKLLGELLRFFGGDHAAIPISGSPCQATA